MLLPFTIEKGNNKEYKYLNTDMIVSIIENDERDYLIEYKIGNNHVEFLQSTTIPKGLLFYPDDACTSVKIFQSKYISKIEKDFDIWAAEQDNLKIISTSSCLNEDLGAMILSVVYTADF